jgi:hypothetical protein
LGSRKWELGYSATRYTADRGRSDLPMDRGRGGKVTRGQGEELGNRK